MSNHRHTLQRISRWLNQLEEDHEKKRGRGIGDYKYKILHKKLHKTQGRFT